jgi:putative membrane-bound dehydrogenase-like protein
MMIRKFVLACLLLCHILSAYAADFTFGELTLTVPDGFFVERVANTPLVDRPIMADLDEQGRLYVADSSGSNADVKTQLREKPHRIVRLEDTDHDGIYDSSVVFAEDLMFPEGVLWTNGALFVSAPPVIWKLTDTDDDGVCDQREVWHDGQTLTGCANDLHGPYLGRDGWIYWCKGAFAEQTYPKPNGTAFVSRAAHIFRKHPEGGLVEAVMTGGMDNPVEVAFSPEGERFFTTTFLQHPGGGRRDGIIHAIYGGVYGKNHDVLEGHPRTGDLMPIMTHLGPAAACALMRYESEALGAGYQGNLFSSLFNMRKITRHELVPDGATYKTVDHDFLTGDHIDFHPTDILEDADGSLLVVDTGGWYKLCCPTSQLPKPEVLGAIYRIRRTNAATIQDPLGLQLDWKQASPAALTERLTDKRPRVAQRAIEQLARIGASAMPALTNTPRPATKQQAIWAMTRMDAPEARAAIRSALQDPSPTIQHTALHSVSVRRDRAAAPSVITLLKSPSLSVQRAAAEALGRVGDGTHVPALLEALSRPLDRVLEHSLRYALIEIGDEAALLSALQSNNHRTQSIALATLHELQSPQLTAKRTFPFLQHTDPALRETAWNIVSAHPEWTAQLIAELPEASKLIPEARRALSKLVPEDYLTNALGEPGQQAAALQIIETASLTEIPQAWFTPLDTLLNSPDQNVRHTVLKILGHAKKIDPAKLPSLAKAQANTPAERLEILKLLASSKTFPTTQAFPFLIERLLPSVPSQERRNATRILTQIKLTQDQDLALIQCLSKVGPMELVTLTSHFAKRFKEGDTALATPLLKALATNPSLTSLPSSTIQQLLDAAPTEAVRVAFEKKVPQSTIADQEERLKSMLASLPEGDVIRGQTVFNSTEAACVTCHAMGYLGGKLGPDLTRIGQIRSRRDLLEAIIYPSASFVRSYETVLLTTTDKQMHLGIQKSENDDHLTLRTGPESESVIARGTIEDIQPGTISLMPPGLDTVITPQHLADLLAFLQNAKW